MQLPQHISVDRARLPRGNLREATQAQNCWNRRRPANNTTGYKGVSYPKLSKSYRASICVEGEKIELRGFATAKEAHRAYLKLAREHFGEFARAA